MGKWEKNPKKILKIHLKSPIHPSDSKHSANRRYIQQNIIDKSFHF